MNDEHLELDEVTGDFVDWFHVRIHYMAVEASVYHHRYMRQHRTIMEYHFEKGVEKLFGHELSFYTR